MTGDPTLDPWRPPMADPTPDPKADPQTLDEWRELLKDKPEGIEVEEVETDGDRWRLFGVGRKYVVADNADGFVLIGEANELRPVRPHEIPEDQYDVTMRVFDCAWDEAVGFFDALPATLDEEAGKAQVIQGEMMTWTPEPWVTYDEDGKRWRVLNPHCSWPSLIAEATDD